LSFLAGGDGGPSNWHDNCGPSLANLTVGGNCTFAQDYLSMINLVRTLGPDANTPPIIYVAAPPPLMQHGSIGANQTVINSVYPDLVPLIAQAANLTTVPISIYSALGGVPDWEQVFPMSCQLSTPWAACPWYCDSQRYVIFLFNTSTSFFLYPILTNHLFLLFNLHMSDL